MLKTCNDEKMRVKSSGEVGIGVTDPQGKLDVGERTDPVGGGCPLGYEFVDDNGNRLIDNGECWRGMVVKDGKVGIDTTNPCAELDVNGEIAVNCAVVINSNGQWVGDPTGLAGPQGLQGSEGSDGATEPQWPIGPTGPAGPQGVAGADGSNRTAGTNRTNRSRWCSGTSRITG